MFGVLFLELCFICDVQAGPNKKNKNGFEHGRCSYYKIDNTGVFSDCKLDIYNCPDFMPFMTDNIGYCFSSALYALSSVEHFDDLEHFDLFDLPKNEQRRSAEENLRSISATLNSLNKLHDLLTDFGIDYKQQSVSSKGIVT